MLPFLAWHISLPREAYYILWLTVAGGTDLVWKYWFETSTEVTEVIAVLMDLHTLTIILDLRVHPIRTLLHGILNGLACFCLQ